MWEIIKNSWRPVFEIALLTIAIYYAFNFVRGTRGAPVVYGFVVLLISMTILTGVLKLEVLSWLLRSFVGFSAVAVLVIFQPELRKILAELGNQPLFGTAH